jgi:RNA polymerase-interacting CarD/CdnL/TRCF family regulator
MQRISERKSSFFENIKILIKHVAKLIKWKRRPKVMKSKIKEGNINNNSDVP